ncbi:hypothetical protein SM124_13200 [Bacillus sp. 31A1R]|uniref:DUF4760 domain-containing protein n=1 Tax=Robertmurraya mangrovi TaxID=3098077 RepID=A0ABU5IZV3_9BACI|nr:hypothetical protein [Bacillus sp. 31A1R]MDZ5472689.1 hypothetical protein [Bacillus sp. 31A1R]
MEKKKTVLESLDGISLEISQLSQEFAGWVMKDTINAIIVLIGIGITFYFSQRLAKLANETHALNERIFTINQDNLHERKEARKGVIRTNVLNIQQFIREQYEGYDFTYIDLIPENCGVEDLTEFFSDEEIGKISRAWYEFRKYKIKYSNGLKEHEKDAFLRDSQRLMGIFNDAFIVTGKIIMAELVVEPKKRWFKKR